MNVIRKAAESGGVALLIAAGIALGGEVPVVTVCDALSHRTAYNDSEVIVVGKFASSPETSALAGDCDAKLLPGGYEWPRAIWLGENDSRQRPSALVYFADYKAEILAHVPKQQNAALDVVPDCWLPGAWVAVHGRFETKTAFPVAGDARRIGFGHLGAYPAQLLFSRRDFWCLLSPDQHAEFETLRKQRQTAASHALWRAIKSELQEGGGIEYFDNHMRGRLFPVMEGTVVSVDDPRRPATIVLAMPDSVSPAVTLRLRHPFDRPLSRGTKLQFEGVPIGCRLNPFMLTFEAPKEKLSVGAR